MTDSVRSSSSSSTSSSHKRLVLSEFESSPCHLNDKTEIDGDITVDDGLQSECIVVPPSVKRIKTDKYKHTSSRNKENTPSTDNERVPLLETPIGSYLPSRRLPPVTQDDDVDNYSDDTGTMAAGAAKAVRGGVVVVTPKRLGYLDWDDYFLGIAILSSKRSKDPDHAEGACIVDQYNRIVAIGYSGFPRGCPDTIFPWVDCNNNDNVKHPNKKRDDDDDECSDTSKTIPWLHSKQPYVCPAITNAILNKCSQDVAGCRLYVMEFPSSDCVKVMIQSGIQELVILKPTTTTNNNGKMDASTMPGGNVGAWTDDEQASRIMLEMAQIRIRYHEPEVSSLTLDFGISNETPANQDNATCSKRITTLTTTTNTVLESDLHYTEDEQNAINILKDEAEYDATKVADNGRRKDYLTWDDYFMSVAFLTAQRSKDPNTQVGACIVDDEHRILGLGYNGMPRGLSDDAMPWARDSSNPSIFTKYPYVTHAEVNAILNKGSANVKGSTIYVALFPCENCAKMIIQSGIRRVVYLSDRYHNTDGCRASRIMLKCANVKLVQYTPSQSKLTVKYDGNMT
jgi:dCMP deaminase